MRQVILDTDTLSYILDRRHPEVLETSKQYIRVYRYFSVSAITVAEIVEGFESQQNHVGTASFLTLMETFEVIPLRSKKQPSQEKFSEA